MRQLLPFLIVAATLIAGRPAAAIMAGQVDDFEDGTTMSWAEGPPSPNPPVNIPDGGPGGAGDNYLENTANGLSGPGSRMVQFSFAQWSGNYVAENVIGIQAQMANLGSTPLYMRVALSGSGGTVFGSTFAHTLLPGSGWQNVQFDVTAAGLSLVGGGAPLNDVLANVDELRVLSAQFAPSYLGDVVDGTLGVDDITAVPAVISVETATWSEIKVEYRSE